MNIILYGHIVYMFVSLLSEINDYYIIIIIVIDIYRKQVVEAEKQITEAVKA